MEYNELTDKERYYSSDDSILNEYAKDVRFSDNQLEVIRHGIENGLDVSVYANPEIPVAIMQVLFRHLKSSNNEYVVRVKDTAEGIVLIHYTCSTKRDAINHYTKLGGKRCIIDVRECSEM